LTQRKV
jgi:hypothetical protein